MDIEYDEQETAPVLIGKSDGMPYARKPIITFSTEAGLFIPNSKSKNSNPTIIRSFCTDYLPMVLEYDACDMLQFSRQIRSRIAYFIPYAPDTSMA